ncbi:glycosyltransferase family 9 protein [Candidatus Pelagibacter sp. HIMB1493]|uniref:glycosyltransferase family 9 protein n=1 Tax=Candidatus Pelagibacter sp. HIMB1493 TaxID=3413334 RepID=UPI003F8332BC
MTKKVLFFSIDRLGDYLIRSSTIKKISQQFNKSEIICSDKNYKLISEQSFFNKAILFNTKNKFINKITFVVNFYMKNYDAVIALDGKNISYFLLLLIKSKNKFTVIYKKQGYVNKFFFNLLKIIFNFCNIKYEILNNRYLIESGQLDNYPLKYKFLKKFYSNIDNEIYYLEKTKKNIFSGFKDEYILIHLDEKFLDINDIDYKFEYLILNLQKKINKKIFISTYNNNYAYYKNLKIKKKFYNSITKKLLKDENILAIENIPIIDFQNMLYNSYVNISCHSGYFVHTSIALNKKTIDIINEKDRDWLQTWLYRPKNYNIIYKSENNNKINIDNILNKLIDEII